MVDSKWTDSSATQLQDLVGGDATTINVSRWNFVKTDIVINGH